MLLEKVSDYIIHPASRNKGFIKLKVTHGKVSL